RRDTAAEPPERAGVADDPMPVVAICHWDGGHKSGTRTLLDWLAHELVLGIGARVIQGYTG
ncbi:hypothetical protein, partial [Escherichia coli]|uniref:hypothetical protein n=1 Tax=Escherichia coli TaxID=562 RepID=UPI001BD56C3D